MKYDRLTVWSTVFAAAIVLAPLGPWVAGPLGMKITGIDVKYIGLAVLAGGTLATVRLALSTVRRVHFAEAGALALIGAAAFGLAIYCIVRIEIIAPGIDDTVGEFSDFLNAITMTINPGWGMYLLLVGGVGLAATSAVRLRTLWRDRVVTERLVDVVRGSL